MLNSLETHKIKWQLLYVGSGLKNSWVHGFGYCRNKPVSINPTGRTLCSLINPRVQKLTQTLTLMEQKPIGFRISDTHCHPWPCPCGETGEKDRDFCYHHTWETKWFCSQLIARACKKMSLKNLSYLMSRSFCRGSFRLVSTFLASSSSARKYSVTKQGPKFWTQLGTLFFKL